MEEIGPGGQRTLFEYDDANGNSVELFVDEVKNVSGRVSSTRSAPMALGVGGRRGTAHLADNLNTAQTRLTRAFKSGQMPELTRDQFDIAIQKLTDGDVTVRFVGSARTQFDQRLINQVQGSFQHLNLNVPRVTFGQF